MDESWCAAGKRISVLFNFSGDSRKYAVKFVAKVFLVDSCYFRDLDLLLDTILA